MIVATVRAMKMNGGVAKADLGAENVEAVKKGCPNLGRHIANVKGFGVPVVVAINHFFSDTDAEIAAVKAYVAEQGAEAILCKHWAQGSAGIEELAHKVVRAGRSRAARISRRSTPTRCRCSRRSRPSPSASTAPTSVMADKSIRDQLKTWEAAGYGHLPVCMAKTQYSFTTDPNVRGAPTGSLGAGARSAAVGGGRVRRGDLR